MACDSLALLVALCIWLQRNVRIHNCAADTPVRVVDSIWSMADLWCRARLVAWSELLGM
jgi:hypothetical protein